MEKINELKSLLGPDKDTLYVHVFSTEYVILDASLLQSYDDKQNITELCKLDIMYTWENTIVDEDTRIIGSSIILTENELSELIRINQERIKEKREILVRSVQSMEFVKQFEGKEPTEAEKLYQAVDARLDDIFEHASPLDIITIEVICYGEKHYYVTSDGGYICLLPESKIGKKSSESLVFVDENKEDAVNILKQLYENPVIKPPFDPIEYC